MAQTVTLSSAGTATIPLNPVAKATTVTLTSVGGSSLTVVQIEVSLADFSAVPAQTANWTLLSSGAAMLSSIALSLTYSVLSPIGGVRLNSSAIVASSGSFTMSALQSISG